MYIPSAHEEFSLPVLRQFIHENPLGVLTTAIASDGHPLIQSSHIPFVIDIEDESEPGTLRGHMARQNPQSQAMVDALSRGGGPWSGSGGGTMLEEEVLVLFTAARQHYVTPKFYVETKPSTGKVVPTWNYAAVQAYGRATVHFDVGAAGTSAFLGRQVHDLSRLAETSIMDYTGRGDRPGPWEVSDAPERYIELLKKAIVGIEIKIDRLQGRFKMSQEMRRGDRQGVVDGFRRLDTEIGRSMADMVQERSDLKEAAKEQ